MADMENFVCCGCPQGWCPGCVADDIDDDDNVVEVDPCCSGCGCLLDCCICQSELEAEIERESYLAFKALEDSRHY